MVVNDGIYSRTLWLTTEETIFRTPSTKIIISLTNNEQSNEVLFRSDAPIELNPDSWKGAIDCLIHCNNRQGPCAWCGSDGMCCTKNPGWLDTSNGCDGTFGGESMHECVQRTRKILC